MGATPDDTLGYCHRSFVGCAGGSVCPRLRSNARVGGSRSQWACASWCQSGVRRDGHMAELGLGKRRKHSPARLDQVSLTTKVNSRFPPSASGAPGCWFLRTQSSGGESNSYSVARRRFCGSNGWLCPVGTVHLGASGSTATWQRWSRVCLWTQISRDCTRQAGAYPARVRTPRCRRTTRCT